MVFVATWCPLCTEPGRKALLDDPAILACGDDSVWVRIDIDRKLTTEGLVDDFGPFSDNSNEITIGYKWELRSRGILEIGLIENIVSFDDSPDFGIHARYSQLF